MLPDEHFCDSRHEASQLAAKRMVAALELDLASRDEAAVVVSGGSTPRECFEILARTSLPWQRVHVVPSDERWVAPDHDASNEKMIRQTLLADRAAKALFLSLYADQSSASQHCASLADEFAALPLPFSAVLLGVGEDGHFASLFPDIANPRDGLDVESATRCLAIATSASPHERISLTLSMLVQSREIILLAFGAAKRAVLEKARLSDSAYPVSRLLRQDHTPVHIVWAP